MGEFDGGDGMRLRRASENRQVAVGRPGIGLKFADNEADKWAVLHGTPAVSTVSVMLCSLRTHWLP